jgi:hypothetical protein
MSAKPSTFRWSDLAYKLIWIFDEREEKCDIRSLIGRQIVYCYGPRLNKDGAQKAGKRN